MSAVSRALMRSSEKRQACALPSSGLAPAALCWPHSRGGGFFFRDEAKEGRGGVWRGLILVAKSMWPPPVMQLSYNLSFFLSHF